MKKLLTRLKGAVKWAIGGAAFLVMLVGLLMIHPFELILVGVPVFALGLFVMIKIVLW